jgi:hypothetical protein
MIIPSVSAVIAAWSKAGIHQIFGNFMKFLSIRNTLSDTLNNLCIGTTIPNSNALEFVVTRAISWYIREARRSALHVAWQTLFTLQSAGRLRTKWHNHDIPSGS